MSIIKHKNSLTDTPITGMRLILDAAFAICSCEREEQHCFCKGPGEHLCTIRM